MCSSSSGTAKTLLVAEVMLLDQVDVKLAETRLWDADKPYVTSNVEIPPKGLGIDVSKSGLK